MWPVYRPEKKAIILAIDVGKNSLHQDLDGKTYFEKSILCASMISKRKLFNGDTDHLALILFGSSHTINHLSPQECCYMNIEIVSDLDIASLDLVKRVNNLSPTNMTNSDWISTFVLAADMLKIKNKDRIYTSFQIIMFSNLATDISLKNVGIIGSCLRQEQIRLTIIGNNCEVIPLNDALDEFINTTEATAVNFKSVIPKLSYYKQKEVIEKQWNATLSFIKVFLVGIFGYEQIDVTTNQSEWLFNKDYDTQMEVNHDELNNELAPIPATDEKLKKRSPRSLHVLGFVKTTNTQRLFLVEGGSYIIKPHKRDVIKFNAICQYMVEREEVMMVRKIDLYIDLENVGLLFPQKEDNENFFVFVKLPYVKEEHLYRISSITEVLKFMYENDNFPNNENEFVMPEMKYKPQLQSLYDCIVQKLIPEPIPKSIMENTIPPLKEIIKTSSPQQEISENSIEDNVVDTKNKMLLIEDESLNVSKECVISELNPIEDFNTHLENGFDSVTVCKKMKYIILTLIEKSTSLKDLIKPISFLKVLKEYYTKHNDVKTYNKLMYVVKDLVIMSGKQDMWSEFIISGLGLITNNEIEASDISQESSEEFVQLSEDHDNDIIIDGDNPTKKRIKNEKSDMDGSSNYHSDGLLSRIIPEPIPKSIMENTIPPLKEIIKTSSPQQEISENSIEDNVVDTKNKMLLIEDESLNVSKECVISELNPIEDFNTHLENGFDSVTVCKKMKYIILTLIEKSTSLKDLIKPISFLKVLKEYYTKHNDVKTYNKLMYVVKDLVIMSGKQDMWSEFIISGLGLITNNEIEASDISQESSEEFVQLSEDHDNDIIIDGDNPTKKRIKNEKSDMDGSSNYHSDGLLSRIIPEPIPKSIMENTIPPLKEIIKTSSPQQEISENSIEDNVVDTKNKMLLIEDESLDVSKECVISELNPIEDFNTHLENGFDSVTVCKKMKYIILTLIEKSTSLKDLIKPISFLKVLKEYYTKHNDVKTYNKLMYVVKDLVIMSGKQDMWSEFIISGIGLITNTEREANDISQESSEEFVQLSEDHDNDIIIDGDIPTKKRKKNEKSDMDGSSNYHSDGLLSRIIPEPIPKSIMEITIPPLNEIIKTSSPQQEISENSIEDNVVETKNKMLLIEDESLNVSKECAISELNPIEDFNTHLENALDSKTGGIGLITNTEREANDISQESSEEFVQLSEDHDNDIIIDGDIPTKKRKKNEKSDMDGSSNYHSDGLLSRIIPEPIPKSIMEITIPPLNEIIKTSSPQQEISENSIEDNVVETKNKMLLIEDESLNVSKECAISELNPIEDFNTHLENALDSKTGGIGLITNTEREANDISQESSEEFVQLSEDHDNDIIIDGDIPTKKRKKNEKSDMDGSSNYHSDGLLSRIIPEPIPKSIMEITIPPLKEIIKTSSPQQEISENSIEDNVVETKNKMLLIEDESLNVSKECAISELNPIEYFNTHLENALDSKTGGIVLITNKEREASDISQELSEDFVQLSEDHDNDIIIDGDIPTKKRKKNEKSDMDGSSNYHSDGLLSRIIPEPIPKSIMEITIPPLKEIIKTSSPQQEISENSIEDNVVETKNKMLLIEDESLNVSKECAISELNPIEDFNTHLENALDSKTGGIGLITNTEREANDISQESSEEFVQLSEDHDNDIIIDGDIPTKKRKKNEKSDMDGSSNYHSDGLLSRIIPEPIPKSIMEITIPPLKEIIKTSSPQQEISENSIEDNVVETKNKMLLIEDESLNVSKECAISELNPIEDFNTHLENALDSKTGGIGLITNTEREANDISQESSEEFVQLSEDHDNDIIIDGDIPTKKRKKNEKSDMDGSSNYHSDGLLSRIIPEPIPKSIMEITIPPLKEIIKTSSPQQEISENSIEDNVVETKNKMLLIEDESLNVSKECAISELNPIEDFNTHLENALDSKTGGIGLITNTEREANDISQESSEEFVQLSEDHDNDIIIDGDIPTKKRKKNEKSDMDGSSNYHSDGLLSRIIPEPIPKSIMEITIPPLKEIIKTSSPQQEISENSIEDNVVETKNKMLLIEDESLNVSKECAISELNPIEDFNTHLENALDSKTGGIVLITNKEREASDISQESSEEFVQLSEDHDNDIIIDGDIPTKKRKKNEKSDMDGSSNYHSDGLLSRIIPEPILFFPKKFFSQ